MRRSQLEPYQSTDKQFEAINEAQKEENNTTQQNTIASPIRAITDEERALLATLPDGELRELVERILRQNGLIACRTDEERETALLDVLALKGITAQDVPAIREYFDRKKGKPAQYVQQNINQTFSLKAFLDEIDGNTAGLPCEDKNYRRLTPLLTGTFLTIGKTK